MKRLINLIQRNTLLTLGVFTWVEGLVFNILYWLEPSSAKNAWLGGFSRGRVLMGGGAALMLVFLSILLFIWFFKPASLNFTERKVSDCLARSTGRQGIWFGGMLIAGLTALILILGWSGNFLNLPPIFYALFAKIYPFIIWAGLFGLQLLFFVLYRIKQFSSAPLIYDEICLAALIALCAGLFLIQAVTLFFRFQPPYVFDQFVWTYTKTAYTVVHPIILVFWILSGILLFVFYKKSPSSKKLVLMSFAWFFLAQLLIPIAGFTGQAAGLERYLQSPISHVLYSACSENPGYARTLSDYDGYFNQDFWLGTKPAGYFIFYSILKDFSAIFNQGDCYNGLANLIYWLFPFLSALSIFFIQKIIKEIYGSVNPLAGLLFFTLPNLLFFTLIADQALYPLLFIISVWLSIKVIQQNQQFLYAIFLGALLYLNVFLSFSLLPSLGFCAIWFLLNLWVNKQKKQRLLLLRQALIVFATFLLFSLIIWGLTGYAPWGRYFSAFSNHRGIKQIQFLS
ncbi:MAG: hypothetical protein LWX83_16625, partial [Anaerolineae bacterium]|nr:hypothetical protein [Anaerolineae bacterium]